MGAAVLWAVIGGALALAVRGPGAAIAVGVVCAVLGLIVPMPAVLTLAKWLPGNLALILWGFNGIVLALIVGAYYWGVSRR